MKKIRFSIGASSPFFAALDRDVERLLSKTKLLLVAKRLLWMKMIFYFLLHIASYVILFLLPHKQLFTLVANYTCIGVSGILLAFNVSHDACHEAFSKVKLVNYLLYHLSFNMQGTNAYLWKVRHTASHHVFPNVDGCDADIDNNPFIRLSPQHPLKKHQKYQHLYSFLVYCVYTLHWFLFKDRLYLAKKRVANLQNKKHPPTEWLLFFFWKSLYLSVLVILPVSAGYPVGHIVVSFLVMHAVTSLLFIHASIATHLCMETQFPKTDDNGYLPDDYYVHQLTTSLDYAPTSKFYNWFLGGFNAHAAHHLYPRLPHTLYPIISGLIERKAKEFNVPYNKLSWLKAIRSHYRYLKMMGASL